MRSIRVRLFLVLSLLFSSVIGFNLASYICFLDLKGQRNQMSLGHQMTLELKGLPSSLNLQPEVLIKLKTLAQHLKPQIRQAAALQMVEHIEKKQRHTFQRHFRAFAQNEAEFQRFTLNQMDHLEQKILFFSGLSGVTFLLGFAFLHLFLKSQVISPIQKLSGRMMDFLHNRFTYQFDSPKNDEIGDLHATFNSLAQRVISHTDELHSLDQAKSDFLSIASHELRTPLTSIKGSLSLLRGGLAGELNEVSTELLGIAEEESDRLIRLINDLLDLAKIEAGKLPLNTEWVFAQELIETTLKGLKGLAQSAHVELVYELDSPHLQVSVDQDRIQQVLTNLVSNAIKFSPTGDSVIVRAKINEKDQIVFEVKDHGKGIDPQDQQLIFQKFRQATGPKNPLVKGTGLGLSIARALVEEHEGEIGLKSTPGEGSTFFFTLSKWRYFDSDRMEKAAS